MLSTRRTLTLLLGLLLCSHLLAVDRFKVEGYPLDNGLQVILKPTSDRDHVSIRLVIGVGFDQFDCRHKELPHLLEHLLFSGIDDSGEAGLEARMQALGGDWNAYTRDSDTTFVLEVPAGNQRAALDLLLAALFNTELNDARIDAARRVIAHENGERPAAWQRLLGSAASSDDATARLAAEQGLACTGPDDLEQLTADALERLRSDWYVANNMTLIMVGDLDRRLPAYLERRFGDLPPGPMPELRELPESTGKAEPARTLNNALLGETAKVHLIFAEPWIGELDHGTWQLLRDYLQWAVYRDLRIEHGLAYGPSVERSGYGSSSFFSINAEVARDDVEPTLQRLHDLLQRLARDGVDPDTVEHLRGVALARQNWTVQGNSALADYYWSSLADYEDGRFADPAKELRQIHPAQLDAALNLLLKQPSYQRVEQPLLGTTGLYASAAGLALLLVLAVLGLVGLLRRR
ncbi:Predicted Zn-dependent peptidase [Pseudomonas flavescens]|uniref:Predicted Zn-dependent peptidase n=1 Tax=Phytopseudomonas flavescens TaxID=29435 RepID=A0A1G8D1Q5_9GAMM|nr:insulinase family protein [Pseudomonas flavescens]SDH51319.1 Predicted Zn-dependent peptidase [Pseudomonas flavescens]